MHLPNGWALRPTRQRTSKLRQRESSNCSERVIRAVVFFEIFVTLSLDFQHSTWLYRLRLLYYSENNYLHTKKQRSRNKNH